MNQALQLAQANNFYKAMLCMRRLLDYERLVMENPAYTRPPMEAAAPNA
jgi:hypothetical protein